MFKTKEQKDYDYRRVHAMYCKGYTFEQIYSECSDMQKWQVMDIIQKIYGNEMMKKERQARY